MLFLISRKELVKRRVINCGDRGIASSSKKPFQLNNLVITLESSLLSGNASNTVTLICKYVHASSHAM